MLLSLQRLECHLSVKVTISSQKAHVQTREVEEQEVANTAECISRLLVTLTAACTCSVQFTGSGCVLKSPKARE
jgi:hypothetical protein